MSKSVENKEVKKSEASESKSDSRFKDGARSFLKRVFLLFILAASSYIAFKYWEFSELKKHDAALEVGKFDNIDSDIIELSGPDGSDDEDDRNDDLRKISAEEMKERGLEFIYQNLLQNQVQIDDLRDQVRDLEDELSKHKARKTIGRVIYSYVDFRQKLFLEQESRREFENFALLTSFDEVLQDKSVRFKEIYKDFYGQQYLSENFAKLIPSLIALKNNNPESGFIERIRYNISKLVTIRKVGGEDIEKVDEIILLAEESLKKEDYKEALDQLLKLSEPYQEILEPFLKKLRISLEIKNLDQEILSYLKILS